MFRNSLIFKSSVLVLYCAFYYLRCFSLFFSDDRFREDLPCLGVKRSFFTLAVV